MVRGAMASKRYDSLEDEWRAMMLGTHPILRKGRRTFGLIPAGPRCKICSAPFGSPGRTFFRRFGFEPWEKNPNICRRCFTGLEGMDVAGAEVPSSFLFADVRRSSDLARSMNTMDFTKLMQRFYEVATHVVLDNDGILDKFVGDEVVGFFIPFMTGENHALTAIRAAEQLLYETGHGDPGGPWIPIGAGVHSGEPFVGVVSRGGTGEFTALGDAVNVAAHLASQAAAGEILVTLDAIEAAHLPPDGLEPRSVSLKGHVVQAVALDIGRSEPSQSA
jgi:adenylate cyclase